MGNKICCEETRTQTQFENDAKIIRHNITVEPPPKVQEQEKPAKIPEPEPKTIHHVPLETIPEEKPAPKEQIPIPETIYAVEMVLVNKKFFHQEQVQQTNPHVKRYGNDTYVGSLDALEQKPNGFGKMYKPDNSLYIGHFRQGKAQGKGAYIFPNGAYYYGDFENNCATSSNGQFVSQTLKYNGGFNNNAFHGQGREQGRNYEFQGTFNQGVRQQGTLKWNNGSNMYTGPFNQNNKFHGKGVLIEPEGKYEGDFVNGEKEGNGTYTFKSGARYAGTYLKGQREGYGYIYQANGTIAYQGELKKGLPHGKGKVPKDKDGKLVEATWDEGIDVSKLPPK